MPSGFFTSTSQLETTPTSITIPHLRWFIAALLLAASVINYIDRQTLSILATTIQRELNLNDLTYAKVVQAFLFAYTFAYLLSGRIVDHWGPRAAQTGFLVWWSIANLLTGLATGFRSLMFYRALLGLGEPGNNTAAAKAISPWFPAREKGIAVGVYTMGGTLGAALAAPIVAFLALRFGWRMAFVVTGAAGLVLALIWVIAYRRPSEHRWLGDGDGLAMFDEATHFGSVEQRAPDFGGAFGIKLIALFHIYRSRLPHRSPSDALAGVFCRALIEAGQEQHRADRTQHRIAAVCAVISVNLPDALMSFDSWGSYAKTTATAYAEQFSKAVPML